LAVATDRRGGSQVHQHNRRTLEKPRHTLSTKNLLKSNTARGRARRRPAAKTRQTKTGPARKKPKKNTVKKLNDQDLLSTPPGGSPEAAGNVDKIRDILFGSQMRDYEKKFTRVEERLGRETAELGEEIKRRFASLEAYMKNEFTALTDQLKSEKGERTAADKELAREIKDDTKAWEKKASQLDEQTTKALRDLRQNVLEESKRLTADMEQKHKDLAGALEKEGEELRATLTDRLALADLFSEVALRLKNEFKIPVKK